MNLQIIFFIILFFINLTALIIACLAYTKKNKGEFYHSANGDSAENDPTGVGGVPPGTPIAPPTWTDPPAMPPISGGPPLYGNSVYSGPQDFITITSCYPRGLCADGETPCMGTDDPVNCSHLSSQTCTGGAPETFGDYDMFDGNWQNDDLDQIWTNPLNPTPKVQGFGKASVRIIPKNYATAGSWPVSARATIKTFTPYYIVNGEWPGPDGKTYASCQCTHMWCNPDDDHDNPSPPPPDSSIPWPNCDLPNGDADGYCMAFIPLGYNTSEEVRKGFKDAESNKIDATIAEVKNGHQYYILAHTCYGGDGFVWRW